MVSWRADIASLALWQNIREQVYRPFSELKGRVRAVDRRSKPPWRTLNYMMYRIGKFEKSWCAILRRPNT
jgi:hypothetical protein